MNTDVLIVGSGCSGLYCALKLPRDIRITLITKSDLESKDSFLEMCIRDSPKGEALAKR